MKLIVFLCVSCVFITGLLSAQPKHIQSYASRDKKINFNELFLDPTHENESVFDDGPKKVVPAIAKMPTYDEMAASETSNPSKLHSEKLTMLLECAFDRLGKKYSFGASNSTGRTDCSLFTQNVFKQVGVSLPRSSAEQSHLGKTVDKGDLQVGDLIFFRTYKKEPSHVGIYIGDNKMIHASFKKGEVLVDDITKTYYQKRYLFAKRHNISATN